MKQPETQENNPERPPALAEAHGSASEREIAYNLCHPAFQRTYWVNLYPNGQMTSDLCNSEQNALHRCTYTGETPDAMQVEIRIVPLTPNDQSSGAPDKKL